jgi:hypothetical protein
MSSSTSSSESKADATILNDMPYLAATLASASRSISMPSPGAIGHAYDTVLVFDRLSQDRLTDRMFGAVEFEHRAPATSARARAAR